MKGWIVALTLVAAMWVPDGVPTSDPSDEFIPSNFRTATAAGCWMYGIKDAPGQGHAETQVIVLWGEHPDTRTKFAPIMSHRDYAIEAARDCKEWFAAVERKLKEEAQDGKKADVPQPQGRVQEPR